jgi:quercetin dioxygenase-like cupin family protein
MNNNKHSFHAQLNQAINYQDGAVVSKEILKTDGGTVTLFAFAANQGLSEHMTPFEALVQVIDGEATITIAGHTHQVKAGEMIHMPAGKPHSLKANQPFKMLLIMLKS